MTTTTRTAPAPGGWLMGPGPAARWARTLLVLAPNAAFLLGAVLRGSS